MDKKEQLKNIEVSRKRWQEIRKWGSKTAKEYSIKSEADVERIIDEFRAEKKS